MEIHLDEILIVKINISMDRVLMVHTASGSYEPVEKKYKVLIQWKDVEDILKLKYGPPQGFCDSPDDEIIFIAVKNNILFCYFYDVAKSSWRYLKIHRAPIEDGINGINIYVESLYLC
ncbi:hypothetical protein H5410_041289 [Solanum commersonii]|uniref:Uncharacterized protein n=1 Tax=Solanum commersonii TaxID=4109 RepID=A0A9J5XT79_SOLCO|nr:hypothetical protein H5410_041289 [Solanum commersonii]